MSPQEDVRYLAGSPHRPAILDALCEDDLRPSELTTRIDATRTTIQRILAGFLERHWVTKRDGTYVATDTGRRVLSAYRDLVFEVERAADYGPFAANIDGLVRPPPPEVYSETTLTVATEQNPIAPMERYVDALESLTPDTLRGISPIVTQTFNDATRRLLEDGTEMEVVIDRSVLEASLESYDGVDDVDGDDRLDVYVSPERIEFGLTVTETYVFVGAYDDRGNLVALVEGTDPALREWATELFDRYRTRSRPVEDVLDRS